MTSFRFAVLALVLAACGDDSTPSSGSPTVTGLTVTTPEDSTVTRTLDAADPDGDPLDIMLGTPMHGTVALAGLDVTYTPAANYHGTDQVSVTVSDGVTSVTAMLDLTITPVNDAPIGEPDQFATPEDTALVLTHAALLANDTDIDDDALAITAVNAATGTVTVDATSVTYTPAANFVGTTMFAYTLTDGTVTLPVIVTVDVGGVNDAPLAVDDTTMTPEDMAVALTTAMLTANDTEPEGQTLTVTAVGSATNGSVVLAGGIATFTPAANFTGAATFEYTVSDGSLTDAGLVTIGVTAINDAPIAVDDARTTPEDTALAITSAMLTANDTDIDGPALTVTAASNPVNGTVTLAGSTATFTPAANFVGTASFDYTVSDGALTDTGSVTITVTAVDDAPVAIDDLRTTPEDTALVLAATELLVNDSDGDGPGLTVTAVSAPVNGTVALASGTITFTPAANHVGIASFDYTVTSGTLTDVGRVTLNVTAVDDAPVAVDDTATAQTEVATQIPLALLLANDTDLDGPARAVTMVGNAQNGTVTLGATSVTFTSATGFVGTATFDYVVTAGTLSDTGTVTVTVTSGPTCGDGAIGTPETCDDGLAVPGDGCSASCAVEPGWTCSGTPSSCAPFCGDGDVVGGEACDDANADDTDGCTSACTIAAVCDVATYPGGDRFAVDPASGHCYVSFDDTQLIYGDAYAACVATGGYLVTITSAAEDTLVTGVQNDAQNPWIGATEDGNDTDDVFDWITSEPFGYRRFAASQPDDDAGFGGSGECLHLVNAAGEWNDTNCNVTAFVVGYICEYELASCGDSLVQPGEECDDDNIASNDGCSATCQFETGCGNGVINVGEECDDDGRVGGDGCSATCQVEDGCGDGELEGTEQCDDNNVVSGDGCSATCTVEALVTFSFTGSTGSNVTFSSDGTSPPLGLASLPVMSRGTGVNGATAANTFSSSGWTLASALDPTEFYTFTVTPAPPFVMTLGRLEFDEKRSGSGPRVWAVRSSLDSFSADLALVTIPDDLLHVNQQVLLGTGFANLSAAVEFRVYAYDADAAGGTWRIDNVELFGSTITP